MIVRTSAAAALIAAGTIVSAGNVPSPVDVLPADPLAAFATETEDPAADLAGLLDLLGRFGGPVGGTLDELIGALGHSAGVAFEEELLAQMGPRIAVAIDLPPFDFAMLALQTHESRAVSAIPGRTGIFCELRDADRFERALRALLALSDGSISRGADGVVVKSLPVWIAPLDPEGGDATRSTVDLFYRIRGSRFVMGFDREWVSHALEGGKRKGLRGGEDFARVFAELDEGAGRFTYLNLPQIRDYVLHSEILTAVLQTTDETAGLFDTLTRGDVMQVGLGSTSRRTRGGTRTTSFGPDWVVGPVFAGGLAAALALPAMVAASPTGDGEETARSIKSIAGACESFSRDTRRYPRSSGWVPVERIAAFLEPVHIIDLPRIDEWDNPILYWSDGVTYRILSTGRDGTMERDWSEQSTPELAVPTTGDMVFADGRFVALPPTASN